MTRLVESIEVPRPVRDAFAYTSDFGNIEQWDPGVSRSVRVTPGPVRVGSRYRLDVVFGPSTIDDIRFEPMHTGTRIDYTADLSFDGLTGLVEPLLGPLLRRVGERAVEGLRRALSGLPPVPESLAIRTAATLFVLVLTAASAAYAQAPPPNASVQIGPASALDSRVGETDPSVLKMFADAGMPTPRAHDLTDAERQSLARAFTALPPVHQRVLRERLRRISFLDGMPNTALTSTVDPDATTPMYDLTIRAGVLHESVSEFLTNKERTCFDFGGSSRTVVIEAGPLDAIVYVLLHEVTHMVESALGLTPVDGRRPAADADLLTTGVWTDRLTVADAYADPLLDGLAYRRGGRPIAVSDAHKVYGALQRTPFASLYGSSNWHDDVAELVAWHHLTSRMGQPYRIVVRERDQDVLVYEPMASPLVQRRLRLLTPMYDTPPV